MPKICLKEGCNYNVFGKGYCKIHQYLRTDKKKSEKKKVKRMRPFSKKRGEELDEYYSLRDKYLEEHEFCEVRGCNNKTTNLHHKKGRSGKLLTDVRYFMACCSECHPKKIHMEDPKWARENGYIL